MVGSLKDRLELAKKIIDHPAIRVALLIWAIIAAYDTFSSQILPETLAKKAPKVREVIVMTSGWLPFWVWLLLLAAILIFASLEFALRRTNKIDTAGGKVVHRKVSARGIAWDFDNPNHYFLGLTGGRDSITVPSFQGLGHNNLGVPIERVAGYLRIDRNSRRYPMRLAVNGVPIDPEATDGIPVDADFTIVVPFYAANKYDEYIPALQFLADFPPFTFVFEYDGKTYQRNFTREDVKSQIFRFTDEIAIQNKPAVTKKIRVEPPPKIENIPRRHIKEDAERILQALVELYDTIHKHANAISKKNGFSLSLETQMAGKIPKEKSTIVSAAREQIHAIGKDIYQTIIPKYQYDADDLRPLIQGDGVLGEMNGAMNDFIDAATALPDTASAQLINLALAEREAKLNLAYSKFIDWVRDSLSRIQRKRAELQAQL